MLIFIILLIGVSVGLVFVGRLLLSDVKSDDEKISSKIPKKNRLTGLSFLKSLIKKKSVTREISKSSSRPDLNEYMAQSQNAEIKKKPEFNFSRPQTGTASVTTTSNVGHEETPTVDTNKLLQEKNIKLEQLQKSLDSELQNRKDFQKVKQILETELYELKRRSHQLQVELTHLKNENQEYKNKTQQLNEEERDEKQTTVQNVVTKNPLLDEGAPPETLTNIPTVTSLKSTPKSIM